MSIMYPKGQDKQKTVKGFDIMNRKGKRIIKSGKSPKTPRF